MRHPALEKFMEAMGIKYYIDLYKEYKNHLGRRVICIKVSVYRDENIEYKQYHCYALKSEGKLKYEEGNEVKGIHQGVLSYLGDDKGVDAFFDELSREKAMEYINNKITFH